VVIVGGFGRLGEGNAVCRKRGMLGIMQRRLYSKVAIVGVGKRGMPFVGREREFQKHSQKKGDTRDIQQQQSGGSRGFGKREIGESGINSTRTQQLEKPRQPGACTLYVRLGYECRHDDGSLIYRRRRSRIGASRG